MDTHLKLNAKHMIGDVDGFQIRTDKQTHSLNMFTSCVFK